MNSKEVKENCQEELMLLSERIATAGHVTSYFIVVNFDGRPTFFTYGAETSSWFKLDSMTGLLHQMLQTSLIDQMMLQSTSAIELDDLMKQFKNQD